MWSYGREGGEGAGGDRFGASGLGELPPGSGSMLREMQPKVVALILLQHSSGQ